jgi:hypothetical protein
MARIRVKLGLPSALSPVVDASRGRGPVAWGAFVWVAVAFAAVLLSPACRVYAGPPFLTDDPEPVELHHWELYLASTGGSTSRSFAATAPHVEINYGAVENVQLHAIAPMAISHGDNGPTDYGYGDTELGVKYRFVQESKYVPMVGVFPLVELPTGSASHGLGNGRVQCFLPVWLQKSFDDDKWTTYGGGGYWLNNTDGAKNHWFFGWELQRKINDHLALGGEIFHQTSDAEGALDRTGVNLGAIIDLNEHHHILFSAGRDIQGPVTFTYYLGYQLTF